ncbi:hypothetical protein M011DRAFT_338963 [Sporormia fimetaria CBS 119925]|uniref:Uncharacterized protein n=1 Tax=Sporormia fimetaria CBS 119925 TaxID=1340428 RepID=A0A6A6VGV8_9PLEO|nr:hypothetical protein M011DRAFT_338963 [Sporormia fimetaria CBS 119925]
MAQASTRPTLAGPQIPGPQTPAQTQQNAGYPNGPHGLGYINSMARTLTRPMMAHPQYAGTLAPVHTQQVPGYANAGFVQEQTQLIQAQAGFTPALTNLNSSSGPVYSNQPNPASLSAGQQLPTQPQAGFTPAQSALICKSSR